MSQTDSRQKGSCLFGGFMSFIIQDFRVGLQEESNYGKRLV